MKWLYVPKLKKDWKVSNMTLFLSMLGMLVLGLAVGGFLGYSRGTTVMVYLFLKYTSATEREFKDMISNLGQKENK